MAIKLNKHGFTLVEVLFSLSVCLLIVFTTTHLLLLTTTTHHLQQVDASTEIGIKSLSQDLYTASHVSYGDSLEYTDSYTNTSNRIYLHNRRVVREPGFVIYMRDVEELYFYTMDNKMFASIVKDNIEKTFVIGVDFYRDIYE